MTIAENIAELVLLPALLLLRVAALSMIYRLRRRERELGYPKPNESLHDVRLLVALNEEILARSCYRRATGGSLKAAKTHIKFVKKHQNP